MGREFVIKACAYSLALQAGVSYIKHTTQKQWSSVFTDASQSFQEGLVLCVNSGLTMVQQSLDTIDPVLQKS